MVRIEPIPSSIGGPVQERRDEGRQSSRRATPILLSRSLLRTKAKSLPSVVINVRLRSNLEVRQSRSCPTRSDHESHVSRGVFELWTGFWASGRYRRISNLITGLKEFGADSELFVGSRTRRVFPPTNNDSSSPASSLRTAVRSRITTSRRNRRCIWCCVFEEASGILRKVRLQFSGQGSNFRRH